MSSSLSTNELQRIFERLDRNREGYVNSKELSQMIIQGMGGSLITQDDLQSLMTKPTLDFIDFVLFYQTLMTKTSSIDDDDDDDHVLHVKAFRVFDVNGDGVITSEELGNVLTRLGMWNQQQQHDNCDSMIRTYDANSDGVLDFQEFKNMLLNHP